MVVEILSSGIDKTICYHVVCYSVIVWSFRFAMTDCIGQQVSASKENNIGEWGRLVLTASRIEL